MMPTDNARDDVDYLTTYGHRRDEEITERKQALARLVAIAARAANGHDEACVCARCRFLVERALNRVNMRMPRRVTEPEVDAKAGRVDNKILALAAGSLIALVGSLMVSVFTNNAAWFAVGYPVACLLLVLVFAFNATP